MTASAWMITKRGLKLGDHWTDYDSKCILVFEKTERRPSQRRRHGHLKNSVLKNGRATHSVPMVQRNSYRDG
mgnify:CR=1 FL=1